MNTLSTTCPLCGGTSLTGVFALRDMPVLCCQLWPDADAARGAPTGDVDLVMCDDCVLIWNRAFDPARMVYAPGYENALHFSPHFQAYAAELAAGLVERHGLKDKHVVEIGCGDGYMLDLMAQHGVASAIGYDPSMAGKDTLFTARDNVEIVAKPFTTDQLDRNFDIVMCRHVLEHLEAPFHLMTDVREAIGERDVTIYFEVPNAQWLLDDLSIWDAIYEHVTYWTAPAMNTLLRRTGYAPRSVRVGYGDQFLMAEGRAAAAEPGYLAPDTAAVRRAAARFTTAVDAELAAWRKRLSELDGKAIVWGAGAKGVTFANALGDAGRKAVAAMVDLNPRKHGLVVPGIAVPVVAPETLKEINPDLVLIANALYETEIKEQVHSYGLAPSFGVVTG